VVGDEKEAALSPQRQQDVKSLTNIRSRRVGKSRKINLQNRLSTKKAQK